MHKIAHLTYIYHGAYSPFMEHVHLNVKRVLLCAMVVLVLCIMVVPAKEVKADSGKITVEADFEVLQYAEGGGHITWHIEGDAATEYRHALLVLLYGDNATTANISAKDLFNRYFVGYGGVESFLEGTQGYKKIRVWGVEIRRSEPLSKGDYGTGDAALEVDTTGLIGTNWNAQDSIEIKYLLGCRLYDDNEKENPVLAHHLLAKALYAPFYYAVNNTTLWDDIHVGIDLDAANRFMPLTSDRYPVTFHTTTYVVGTLSYTAFSGVNALAIRTPVGYVIKYDAAYDTWVPASFTYAAFDPIECPAVGFIVLVVFFVLLRYFPQHFFTGYRAKLPRELRAGAKKIRWWHYTVLLLLLLYILIYFFTTVYVNHIIFIIIGVALLVPDIIVSRELYRRKLASVKIEPVKTVPATMTPAEAGVEKTIQCGNCGTSFSIRYSGVPVQVECPKCHAKGMFQGDAKKEIEITEGMNNLILTTDMPEFYQKFAKLAATRPVLCLTTQYPDKLKQAYGLQNAKFEWISTMSTKEGLKPLDPKRLEFEIMLAISTFMRQNQNAVILIDGLEMLIVENGYDKVLKFVKKVIDIANTTKSMLVIPINPSALSPDQEAMLSKAFDRVWKA